jgi:hypothetical protein
VAGCEYARELVQPFSTAVNVVKAALRFKKKRTMGMGSIAKSSPSADGLGARAYTRSLFSST